MTKSAEIFLATTAAGLRAMATKLKKIDVSLVEQDIAARRIEADIGWQYAKLVERIVKALAATGSNLTLDAWVKAEIGCDIRTLRRRKRLYAHWAEYVDHRRQLGQCGQTGLLFALSLVTETSSAEATNGQDVSVRSAARTINIKSPKKAEVTKPDDRRCQFITGDALIELPKLKEKSVHAVVASPPYWPSRREYHGRGIGFEKTLTEYIDHLTAIFREVRRVLRDDGVAWINIGDSYLKGDLLFIPERLGMALQTDGWVCRKKIIWQKSNMRPESVEDRPSKDYESVLMLTRSRNAYTYDSDPIRIPLKTKSSLTGRKKPGVMRNDYNWKSRHYNNPLGRNSGSVWYIAPSGYRGGHSATMPTELARRCLLASCPEKSVVLDPFGGAATTALVALELGHKAISIEISTEYTEEGRQRLGANSD